MTKDDARRSATAEEDETRPLVLQIYNQHAPGSGTPPVITNSIADQYIGYFANEHGEQWVFIYAYDTHQGILVGGDAGWEKQYPVVDGEFPELVLSKEEQMWLAACWRAATILRGKS